jgi:hypothetical protein
MVSIGSSTSIDRRSRSMSKFLQSRSSTYFCVASSGWQNKVGPTSSNIQREEDGGSYATALALTAYNRGLCPAI